jgi:hypothetical protein
MKFLKTSESALANERRRKARLYAINRKVIGEVKALKGCELCGRMDLPPEQLHFHHRVAANKWRKISGAKQHSTAALVAEITQCRLWCRRSHQHFHATGEVKPCAIAFSESLQEVRNEH